MCLCFCKQCDVSLFGSQAVRDTAVIILVDIWPDFALCDQRETRT